MSARDEIREHVEQHTSRNGSTPATTWPKPLGSVAFHGLAGKVVRKIEPQSEADTSALLVQFLIGTGVACGRGPYFTVEASRHGLNEFGVVVGDTSKGRKGTGYDRVMEPIGMAEETFAHRCVSGLSSGEGLIWEVRDQRLERRRAKKDEEADEDGRVTDVADEGVIDKRLLVYESELACSERGRPGEAYFVTDGEPIEFRRFVTELLATQGVTPGERNTPPAVARTAAAALEAVWPLLRRGGAPPVTRLAVWLSSLECTVDISKAREQLGYSPVKTREEGLTELGAAA